MVQLLLGSSKGDKPVGSDIPRRLYQLRPPNLFPQSAIELGELRIAFGSKLDLGEEQGRGTRQQLRIYGSSAGYHDLKCSELVGEVETKIERSLQVRR